MTRSIDEVLARAVLADGPHTYSDQEIEAAESRIAAGVADHVPKQRRPSRQRQNGAEVVRYLDLLCRTVIERDGALQHMAAFLGGRIPQPDGARVLGCVLQLAGREDSARFWWQFAAGAGDGAAAYCLYLHHMTLGEEWEAELWHRQSCVDGEDGQDGVDSVDGEEEMAEGPGDGSDPRLVLRVLALLQGDRTYLTEVAAAVLHYVPEAVHFVDELELPLPAADFAQRIEELTATG